MAATNPLKLPRGLRNNNPGNIRISPTRYKGEIVPSSDRAFKQFKSRGWGYRAIFVLIESYHKRGIRTIRQIISRYAPSFENNTEKYISSVCESSLLGADVPLDITDKETMIHLLFNISTNPQISSTYS